MRIDYLKGSKDFVDFEGSLDISLYVNDDVESLIKLLFFNLNDDDIIELKYNGIIISLDEARNLVERGVVDLCRNITFRFK